MSLFVLIPSILFLLHMLMTQNEIVPKHTFTEQHFFNISVQLFVLEGLLVKFAVGLVIRRLYIQNTSCCTLISINTLYYDE